MEEAERHCDRLGVIDRGRLVEQGEPARAASSATAVDSLEEVFTAVTGRSIDERREQEGRLADVRAQRRVARRLG